MKETEKKRLIEKLVIANRILNHEQLTVPLGHISVRVPDEDQILISRSIAPGVVTGKDILRLDLSGKILEGKGKLYAEIPLHLSIYRLRKDIECVAHIHPLHVIALSMAKIPLQPMSNEVLFLSDEDIPIYDDPQLIDTEGKGDDLARALGNRSSISIKGHGAVVVGKTIEETVVLAVHMEQAAKLQMMANVAGKPLRYPLDQIESWRNTIKAYTGGKPPEREWDYYKAKVSKRYGQ
jgi:ribulose-5-phosphate 4-epimerase/fuculose-1-phosphate aldolase